MRRVALLVLLAAVLVALPKVLGTTLPSEVTDLLDAGSAERGRARVVRVTDGDTLKVRMPDGSEEYVRILGIDTPEVHEQLQCGGQEATAAMAALAPVGSSVTLVPDPTQGDRDRYDRLLRYVHRPVTAWDSPRSGLGLAKLFVFRNDPLQRASAYERAARRAKQEGRGLWSRCWR